MKRKSKDELSGANRELHKKRASREQIIAEYLSGDYTFRALGDKYNIPRKVNRH